jgi:hypothetical protein
MPKVASRGDVAGRMESTIFESDESFLGNSCIDIPAVKELFLQLDLFGPPATQYLPRYLFSFVARTDPCALLSAMMDYTRAGLQRVTS